MLQEDKIKIIYYSIGADEFKKKRIVENKYITQLYIMDEVKLKVDDNIESTDSSKDCERQEMLWTSKQESYFEKILHECIEKQKAHDVKAHKFKSKYIYMSLPSIVLPLMIASVNEFLKEDYNYINTTSMSIAGILSGVNSFYNFGSKYQKHNEYSGRYDELAGEIEALLTKNRRFRPPVDVSIERIKNQFNNLNNNAPML